MSEIMPISLLGRFPFPSCIMWELCGLSREPDVLNYVKINTDALNEAVSELSESRQIVLQLHLKKGMSLASISREIGLSRCRVSQLYVNALRRLKEKRMSFCSPYSAEDTLLLERLAHKYTIPYGYGKFDEAEKCMDEETAILLLKHGFVQKEDTKYTRKYHKPPVSGYFYYYI